MMSNEFFFDVSSIFSNADIDEDDDPTTSSMDAFINPKKATVKKPKFKKISSLRDLIGFTRISSTELVHKSTKDLWALGYDDQGNMQVARLFDDDGKPIKCALGAQVSRKYAKKVRHFYSAEKDFQTRGEDTEPSKLVRTIPSNHQFDKKSIKPLVRLLWSTSVSLGHVLSSYRQFSKLKSVSFSPDGLIGGRGYVHSIKQIRRMLFEASELLSVVCDTLYDEVNAPHWKPKLAELDNSEIKEVKNLISDAEDYIENPEGEAEEDIKDKKVTKKKGSSIPVQNLPGPRVQHIGPGEGLGPYGSENTDEPLTNDEWGVSEGENYDYDYRLDLDTGYVVQAASSLPFDDTPTQAFDFGLGFGEGNNAEGQASYDEGAVGYSQNTSGPFGPASGLPGDTVDKVVGDGSDGLSQVEYSATSVPNTKGSASKLPGDDEPPVARSDYYPGDRGNDFNVRLRGSGPITNVNRYDLSIGDSLLYRQEDETTPRVEFSPDTSEMLPDKSNQTPVWVDGRPVYQGPYRKTLL